MSLKPDVAKDLLCVIAHGTLKARVPGAHLLFYYWPALNPTLYDRRGVNTKFNGIVSMRDFKCLIPVKVFESKLFLGYIFFSVHQISVMKKQLTLFLYLNQCLLYDSCL